MSCTVPVIPVASGVRVTPISICIGVMSVLEQSIIWVTVPDPWVITMGVNLSVQDTLPVEGVVSPGSE
jgi:hypothetical protein